METEAGKIGKTKKGAQYQARYSVGERSLPGVLQTLGGNSGDTVGHSSELQQLKGKGPGEVIDLISVVIVRGQPLGF